MHQIVGIDLNTRFFPSSNYHEGEVQVTRGCHTYGEAGSIVPINQNVSQLFELFFKGFPNPLWLPYLDNDNLTLPCEFSFESGRQDGSSSCPTPRKIIKNGWRTFTKRHRTPPM
jgi:hypothetical protein